MRQKTIAAALASLLLLLAACRPVLAPTAADPATPSPAAAAATALPALTGSWTGLCRAELAATLAPELEPLPAEPLQAAVSLSVDETGLCLLRCDYAPCAEALRPVYAAFLRELWSQPGESRSGAEPEAAAAALLEERTPPPLRLAGSLTDDRSEICWEDGSVSPLSLSGETLTLAQSPLGALTLQRADGA